MTMVSLYKTCSCATERRCNRCNDGVIEFEVSNDAIVEALETERMLPTYVKQAEIRALKKALLLSSPQLIEKRILALGGKL